MCIVCAQSWNKAELGKVWLFHSLLVDLLCLQEKNEKLLEDTGKKVSETNSVLLHKVSSGSDGYTNCIFLHYFEEHKQNSKGNGAWLELVRGFGVFLQVQRWLNGCSSHFTISICFRQCSDAGWVSWACTPTCLSAEEGQRSLLLRGWTHVHSFVFPCALPTLRWAPGDESSILVPAGSHT